MYTMTNSTTNDDSMSPVLWWLDPLKTGNCGDNVHIGIHNPLLWQCEAKKHVFWNSEIGTIQEFLG